MLLLPPSVTRTVTRFPYTTLFRSSSCSFRRKLRQYVGLFLAIHSYAASYSACLARCRHDKNNEKVPDATLGILNKVTTGRSEAHTSELQSLMRISYTVFGWTKNKYDTQNRDTSRLINR